MKATEGNLTAVGEAIVAELEKYGATLAAIDFCNGRWAVMATEPPVSDIHIRLLIGKGDTLGAAYTDLLHKLAGTTPPPF